MKLPRLLTTLALTSLFAAAPLAHAWEVEDDGYAETGADSDYSALDDHAGDSNSDSASDDTVNDTHAATSDEEQPAEESDGETDAPPPLPPVEDDYDDEDLRPKRRHAPSYDDHGDEDADGWAPIGGRASDRDEDDWGGPERRHGRERDDEEEDDSDSTASSFFGPRNIGLTAELTLGSLFRQSSFGSLDPKFGLGLAVSWNMGRMLFDPDLWLLHKGLWLELSWLMPFGIVDEEGTETTRVTQSQHNLSLSLMFGCPLWRLLVYGKVGPSLYVGGLTYDVDGSQGNWSVLRGGVVYGVGVHTMFFVTEAFGLSARIELLGHRRHYYNDLQFSLNLGAAF